MHIKSKKINEKEYIVYLMDETNRPLKAIIIKADIEDMLWQ